MHVLMKGCQSFGKSSLVVVLFVQFVLFIILYWSVHSVQPGTVVGEGTVSTSAILLDKPRLSNFSLAELSVKDTIPAVAVAVELSAVPVGASTGYVPVPAGSTAYIGTAVMVMVHSPKWFQRRYTMMVNNIIDNLPGGWIVQLYYINTGGSKIGIELNKGLQRLIDRKRVVLTEMSVPFFKSVRTRNELLKTRWFWENALAEKVLLFGGNSVICSNSPWELNDFVHWDYIGGPWGYSQGRRSTRGMGGDGGFSLRSRSVMLQVIEQEDKLHDEAVKSGSFTVKLNKQGKPVIIKEDEFFVSAMLKMKSKSPSPDGNPVNLETLEVQPVSVSSQEHKKSPSDWALAPMDATRTFSSLNGFANVSTFSVSGTLGGVPWDLRDMMLILCPEYKMLFPTLHEPNCFGASPNGDKCAKTICALNKTRRGGC